MSRMTKEVFSGDESRKLWKLINRVMWKGGKIGKKKAKRKKLSRRVWDAMYLLGCKCQELEAKLEAMRKEKP